MGKIGVYYNACTSLIRSIRKCKDELKEEDEYVSRSLRALGKISENYPELNQIHNNLNSIKSKNNKDINKVDLFGKNLDCYVDKVKKSDNDICS